MRIKTLKKTNKLYRNNIKRHTWMEVFNIRTLSNTLQASDDAIKYSMTLFDLNNIRQLILHF